jgi:ABC-type branched-subunit amino acid transport system substrate-binding protein
MAANHNAVKAILCVLVMLSGWMVAAAQDQPTATPDDELLFLQGVSAFDSGHYREAASLFERLQTVHPQSIRMTAATVMKAKALYWLGENMESARTARSLLSTSPSSAYAADAHFVVGSVYYRIGRIDEALEEYMLAWQAMPQPVPPRLFEALGCMVDTIAGRDLSMDALTRAIVAEGPREYSARLILNLAERYAKAENIVAARRALDTLLSTFPEEQGKPRAMKLLVQVAERTDVKLGILLPLMRNDPPTAAKEIASDVNDGIVFAVEQFMQLPGQRMKIQVITCDTERDPVVAARLVKELASDQGVVGIIGPMFSSTTVTAARAAQEASIPMISPTANANGIAALGPFVFQANPDYEMRGRAMARYAVDKLGFRNLVVLAPSDAYGKYLVEGFAAEVRRLGATIVATEWYERGSSNLTSQLRNIRRAGLRLGADTYINFGGKKKLGELMKLVSLGVPVRVLDSLLHKGAMVKVSTLLAPGDASRLDSLGIRVVYNEQQVDSLDTPITGIQAVYAPISSPDEIGVISSQIVYFNLQAQLLGSGEWNNLSELDQHRRYCSGVMFESDSFVDTTLVSYQEWQAAYVARYHRRPSKNSLLGYDTANLVLQELRDGATTRHMLARALASTRGLQGYHATMGFSSRRVNDNIFILQFDGQNIRRIDEIRVE